MGSRCDPSSSSVAYDHNAGDSASATRVRRWRTDKPPRDYAQLEGGAARSGLDLRRAAGDGVARGYAGVYALIPEPRRLRLDLGADDVARSMTPAAPPPRRPSAAENTAGLAVLKACLAAAASSMVVFVLLAEVRPRLAGWKPGSPPGRRSSARSGQYALAPGSISTMPGSKAGSRANKPAFAVVLSPRNRPATKRIVVLGDPGRRSATRPEEGPASRRCSIAPTADARPEGHVVNGSDRGVVARQERMFVRRYGGRLKPDLILVTVILLTSAGFRCPGQAPVGSSSANAFAWLGARSALVN